MGSRADAEWIMARAKALGFDLCGVAKVDEFAELAQFEEWLARGYAGEMKYLEDPRRREPARVMDGARSVIVCALNYNTKWPYSVEAVTSDGDEPRGWISRYAWGDDYHEVMWEKLNALAGALKERFAEPFAAGAYADTGPVAERVLAKHAGLGWLGKNTLLLNEELGSWLFLGVIATTLELAAPATPVNGPPPDLCGNCRQCLDACPTGALVEPYVLDARRCISYLTIELRGSIGEEFREALGWQVYGCDICQDVCPFNRSAPRTELPEFAPRAVFGEQVGSSAEESLFRPRLEWLAGLSEEEFREKFRGSAIKRTKRSGLLRNACLALGNARIKKDSPEKKRIVELLGRLSQSKERGVAESARWALARLT